MGNETIMLAKTYKSYKDLIFPCQLTEKLDGVPGDFYNESGEVKCRTRQGEPITSVDHICKFLQGKLPKGAHVIGELYFEGADFKDISGMVRREKSTDSSANLILHVYDYYIEGKESTDFQTRLAECVRRLKAESLDDTYLTCPIKFIPGCYCIDIAGFELAVKAFKQNKPDAEGIMIRALHGAKSYFKSGWRSPGMLKMKTTCDIDLPIHSFEEAISKDGTPLGMVGRINVEYNNAVIGVGPGKMTHVQRTMAWVGRSKLVGKMIEIKYMPDDSYEALREPRFYRFRPDRD